MSGYVFRRSLQFIPTLVLVSVVVFSLVRAMPGNAAAVLLGPQGTAAQVEAMARELGLDRPIWLQYGMWIRDISQGDLGYSWINGFPVSSLILRNLSATVELSIVAMILAVLIAFPVGIMGALRPKSLLGRLASTYIVLAIGVPSFWLGILLVLFVSLRLGWLPPSGYVSYTEDPLQWARVITLPAITLAVHVSAVIARFVRSAIVDVLGNDYVRTARSKGLRHRAVLVRHVLRNALLPIVTMIGLQTGGLLGGAVVVESIFAWPGIGRLLVSSIQTRDYAVVQAIILLGAATFLTVNLLTDLVYGALDPRIKSM